MWEDRWMPIEWAHIAVTPHVSADPNMVVAELIDSEAVW